MLHREKRMKYDLRIRNGQSLTDEPCLIDANVGEYLDIYFWFFQLRKDVGR